MDILTLQCIGLRDLLPTSELPNFRTSGLPTGSWQKIFVRIEQLHQFRALLMYVGNSNLSFDVFLALLTLVS